MEMKREKYAYIEGFVSISGNFGIFIVKLIIGIIINSIALIADAYHTLTDLIGSIIVILGYYFASRPPDEEHPYGHGRIEHIATVLGSIVLFLTGIFIFYDGISRIISPESVSFDIILMIIVLSTAIVKELMAWLAFNYGKRIGGDPLLVDAWHHRSDAILTVGVVIVIFLSQYFKYFDGLFSIAIAMLIIYESIKFSYTGISKLIGEKPDEDNMKKIDEISREMKLKVHDVKIHDYGEKKIVVLHIDLRGDYTASKAHEIASEFEKRVLEKTGMEAIVHVDTFDVNIKNEIEKNLDSILKEIPEIKSYHDVEVYTSPEGGHVDIHIVVDKNLTIEKIEKISKRIEKTFSKVFPKIKVVTHFETEE